MFFLDPFTHANSDVGSLELNASADRFGLLPGDILVTGAKRKVKWEYIEPSHYTRHSIAVLAYRIYVNGTVSHHVTTLEAWSKD